MANNLALFEKVLQATISYRLTDNGKSETL